MSENREVDAILHESEHVQQAIGRAIGTIYALFGIVLPGVFGAIIIAASKHELILSKSFIGLILVSIVSLAILYSNGLWAESFEYMRYKYGELHPRLYSAIDKKEWPNFMQFMKKHRKKESWIAMVLFQSTAILLTLGYATALILSDHKTEDIVRTVYGLISLVLISITIYSSNNARKHWLEITDFVEKNHKR